MDKRQTHLTIMIGWIWFVTALDVYHCQYLLPENELNPIARIIMVNFGLWTMLAIKIFGTWIATEILRHLPLYYSVAISFIMLLLLLILEGVILV